jgi:hypothetical protein
MSEKLACTNFSAGKADSLQQGVELKTTKGNIYGIHSSENGYEAKREKMGNEGIAHLPSRRLATNGCGRFFIRGKRRALGTWAKLYHAQMEHFKS